MRSLKLLVSLLSLVATISGCGSMSVSDWQATITLPASKDCYGFNVVSGKEQRWAANDPVCIRKKARSIYLDYENYKILRRDIETNCQWEECTQIKGALDNLFFKLIRVFSLSLNDFRWASCKMRSPTT